MSSRAFHTRGCAAPQLACPGDDLVGLERPAHDPVLKRLAKLRNRTQRVEGDSTLVEVPGFLKIAGGLQQCHQAIQRRRVVRSDGQHSAQLPFRGQPVIQISLQHGQYNERIGFTLIQCERAPRGLFAVLEVATGGPGRRTFGNMASCKGQQAPGRGIVRPDRHRFLEDLDTLLVAIRAGPCAAPACRDPVVRDSAGQAAVGMPSTPRGRLRPLPQVRRR